MRHHHRDDLAKELEAIDARLRAVPTHPECYNAINALLAFMDKNAPELIAALRTPDGDAQQAALEEVRACMINGGDGVEGDFGWNIFRLTRARPMILAALSASRPMGDIKTLLAEREREVVERCAAIAEKWRDENKASAAKARRRERLHGIGGYESPQLADQLDGAAIECNAIAQAIRQTIPDDPTNAVEEKPLCL